MAITKQLFGLIYDGIEVTKYTISNDNGFSVSVLDLGAALTCNLLPLGVSQDISPLPFPFCAGFIHLFFSSPPCLSGSLFPIPCIWLMLCA